MNKTQTIMKQIGCRGVGLVFGVLYFVGTLTALAAPPPPPSMVVIEPPPLALTGLPSAESLKPAPMLQARVLAPSNEMIFEVGTTVATTDALNVRDYPSLTGSQVLNTAPAGASGVVRTNHIQADGYRWQVIELTNGTMGWMATRYLNSSDMTPVLTVPEQEDIGLPDTNPDVFGGPVGLPITIPSSPNMLPAEDDIEEEDEFDSEAFVQTIFDPETGTAALVLINPNGDINYEVVSVDDEDDISAASEDIAGDSLDTEYFFDILTLDIAEPAAENSLTEAGVNELQFMVTGEGDYWELTALFEDGDTVIVSSEDGADPEFVTTYFLNEGIFNDWLRAYAASDEQAAFEDIVERLIASYYQVSVSEVESLIEFNLP